MYGIQRWSSRVAALTALALLAGATQSQSAGPQDLDAALAAQAPQIVRYLREHGYKNVGVLKFLVARGKGALQDNVGTLNRNLPNRLEAALVLALPDDEMGLITRASDAVAASGNKRATHRTAAGRREFFRINPQGFRRAWGNEEPVRPDAFLTGEVRLASDLRQVEVKILAFDRKDPTKLATVCTFEAAADARTLSEAGVSFARARGTQEPEESDSQIVLAPKSKFVPQSSPEPELPSEDKNKNNKFKDVVKDMPVRLDILMNGKEVEPGEEGQVPEPKQGDELTFRLTNEGKETYGVLLRVNGKITIFPEEDVPDLESYK